MAFRGERAAKYTGYGRMKGVNGLMIESRII